MTDRLAWYAARACAMSPREIAWRVGSTAAPLLQFRPTTVLGGAAAWDVAYRHFREGVGRPVLLDAARAAGLAAALPTDAAAVVAAADLVRERRFGFFGQEPVPFPGDAVDWNLDPRTGHRWPLVAATGIDHRTCPGDPKWIWEVNRLQHLPWLAQAWLFTGDRGYADAALEQLDGFLVQNPVGRGIAWRGGFEAGIRAISVAVALQGLRDAPGMSIDRYRRAVTMLAASARRAWSGRSRFSSANNHLIGEMTGVAVVAILHPEIAGAARAEARAVSVLAHEAGTQILPDGGGAEQSSAYQIFTSDLLLLSAALLRLRGDRPPVEIEAALRRGSAYLRALVVEGDPSPRYGDDDNGFALRLNADPTPTLRRHLAAVTALIGTPAAASDISASDISASDISASDISASSDLAGAWLAGPVPVTAAHRQPAPPRDLYAHDTGLVILRRGGLRITMDVGPLGYLSIAAHGHADALAVTLTDGGRNLIGDPGTGSYYAEPEWRTAFRGTRMHPTASVDDLDQSVPGGPFLWIRHAVTTVRAVDLVRGIVDAEHDGYTRLREPVTHRRWLVAPPGADTVVVVDRFTGPGTHRVRTAWPLHPDLTLHPNVAAGAEGGVHVAERDGVPVLAIATAASAPVTAYAVRGDEDQRLGWWSHTFESRTPAWLVGSVVEDAVLPLVVATVLTNGAATSDPVVQTHDDRIDVSWSGGGSVRIDTCAGGAVTVGHVTAGDKGA